MKRSKRKWPSAPLPQTPPISADERRSCLEKERFSSREAARANARRFGEHHAVDLDVYECRYCDGWHLTRVRTAKRAKGPTSSPSTP